MIGRAWLAVAVVVLSAVTAKAGFLVTDKRTDLSRRDLGGGLKAGLDLIMIFARDESAYGEGNVSAADLTLAADNPYSGLVIGYPIPTRASSSADVTGSDEAFAEDGAYRFNGPNPSYYSFLNLLGDPTSVMDSNPADIIITSPRPANGIAGYMVPSISVSGVRSGGVDAVDANDGKGALIAVAVVPHGENVSLTGALNDDAGPPQPIYYDTVIIPEPGHLAWIGLVMLGSLARQQSR